MTNEVKVTENTNVISINEYRTLVDQVNDLKNINSELKIDKASLKEQLKAEQDKKVDAEKVIIKTVDNRGWDKEVIVEYKNLADIRAEAKENLDKEVKKELSNLKANIVEKEDQISALIHDKDIIRSQYSRDFEIEKENLKDRYEKKYNKQDKTIASLEKELEDTKKGQSEEQLKEAQASIIANLKLINEKLQDKFDEIVALPWWKRIFAPIDKISEFMQSIGQEVRDLFEAKESIKKGRYETYVTNRYKNDYFNWTID